MHEISPVLTGTLDATNAAPTSVNFTSGGSASDGASLVRKTTDAGSTTNFSFSDFVDMVNPLQHLPVVSSIYREATDTSINPVSRVVGDILYGGAFGVASAVFSAATGAGDSVMEAKSGKDAVGNVVAALFDDETKQPGTTAPETQIADASPTVTAVPLAPVPAATQSSQTTPALTPAGTPAAKPDINLISNNLPLSPAASIALAKAYPQTGNNLPYGGVMAPTRAAMTRQDNINALTQGSGIRIGNTIYAGRSLNVAHQLQAAASPAAVTTSPSAAPVSPETMPALLSSPVTPTSYTSADPSTTLPAIQTASSPSAQSIIVQPSGGAGSGVVGSALPSALSDDSLILKALGHYSGTASFTGVGSKGSLLDMTN